MVTVRVPEVPDYIPHWIDGGPADPVEGGGFDNINPATGRVINQVAAGSAADVDRAVAAALRGQARWAALAPADRGRLLRRLADCLEQRADWFAFLDTVDSGRPIRDTRGRDVPRAVGTLEFYAGLPDKIRGAHVAVPEPLFNYTRYEPFGVVGAIIPWNYPLTNAITKVAPALACGNAVVLKPAEQTPMSAWALGAVAREAGLPDGVINIVQGTGPGAGAALVRHSGVPKIAFTGSTEVGLQIAAGTGGRVKSFTLELGGKSPNIVFADADLDQAAAAALFSVFMNQGQTCTAGTRLLVQADVAEPFTEMLVQRAEQLTVGDPLDPDTYIGSLVSREQWERVRAYVTSGLADGARLRLGGALLDRPEGGFYLTPTIFTGVHSAMRIAREEIFGPVLSVLTFTDEDDALRLAHETDYGLAAAVWTRDVARAHRMAHRLRAGLVWVNTMHALSPASPYGGYGQSGVGNEMGLEAVTQYMRLKSVWLNLGPYTAPWSQLSGQ